MKIDPNVNFLKSASDANAAVSNREALASKPVTSSVPPASAVQLASATAQLPSTNSDFNAARVAQIREDISAGRYEVNPAKIADGLMASVRELLSSKQQ
jgi:negative regulator of flagellin synthesis FlgM